MENEAPILSINKHRHITIAIWFFLVAFLVVLVGYFYLHNANSKSNNKEITNQQLLAKVSYLMVLPAKEVPTIATVTDVNRLKNQEFFANAHNGDKLLIYINADKAILYNPAKNIIVNVAPINPSSVPGNTAVKK